MRNNLKKEVKYNDDARSSSKLRATFQQIAEIMSKWPNKQRTTKMLDFNQVNKMSIHYMLLAIWYVELDSYDYTYIEYTIGCEKSRLSCVKTECEYMCSLLVTFHESHRYGVVWWEAGVETNQYHHFVSMRSNGGGSGEDSAEIKNISFIMYTWYRCN